MANKKQLAILKQGVAAWNKWREENPDAKIDLQGARLKNMELSRANFRYADIRGTNFKKSKLKESDFSQAIMGFSRLSYNVLNILSCILFFEFIIIALYILLLTIRYSSFKSKTILFNTDHGMIYDISHIHKFLCDITFQFVFGNKVILTIALSTIAILSIAGFISYMFFTTDFSSSDLTCCIFCENDISLVSFKNAVIRGACWHGTKISDNSYILEKTIFSDPDLLKLLTIGKIPKPKHQKYYIVIMDIINKVIFKREIISKHRELSTSLKGKKISGGYLVGLDLRDMDLRETDLLHANLSRADITGAKLYGSARENWIIDGIRCDYVYWDEAGEQRTPPDRDFRPGEFEELYKQLPTFEYVFANGFTPLDPLIMDRVVQAVNQRHKEFSLELVNFDKRGQPHATFTVCRLDYVDAARKNVTEIYEKTIEYLMQENEEKNRLIERQNNFIDQLIKKTPSIEDLKQMGDTYNNYGQTGAMGKSASASGNTFQQITADLSRLHEEMQRSAKTPEQRAAAEDVAKAAQAAREQNEPAMLQHLKNAGKFAFDCAKTVGTDVAAEYLKKMTLGM